MVKIRSNLAEFSDSRLRRILADLPRAKEYRLTVKPLRYRKGPHLQAECDYESKTITVQVPEPFRPFRQRIPYRAKRAERLGDLHGDRLALVVALRLKVGTLP